MTSLTHIMVDLETLGTVPGCVAFSIGAVEFFPNEYRTGKEFYEVVNVTSSLDVYLREELDTVEWWEGREEEAKVALYEARAGEGMDLTAALAKFNGWQQSMALKKNVRLWGNGADFDNPILRVMYDAAKVQPYGNPFGGRCYRTVKNLDELLGPAFSFTKIERQGTYHNALDDAKSQAWHLMDNLRNIRSVLSDSAGQE